MTAGHCGRGNRTDIVHRKRLQRCPRAGLRSAVRWTSSLLLFDHDLVDGTVGNGWAAGS
jgi:hypothetical protein